MNKDEFKEDLREVLAEHQIRRHGKGIYRFERRPGTDWLLLAGAAIVALFLASIIFSGLSGKRFVHLRVIPPRVTPLGTPKEVVAALEAVFPGWVPIDKPNRKYCGADNQGATHWLLSGDFNGDGQKDYAAGIIHANSRLTVALLANGSRFEPVVVHRVPTNVYTWDFINVVRKGSVIPDGSGNRFATDAIGEVACGKASVAYAYLAGQFIRYQISD